MGDENSPIDFSLVDTDLVRSPNDIPDDFDNINTVQDDFLDTRIPESAEDAVQDNNKGTVLDGNIIRLLLDEAGKTSGVNITEHMATTATALAHNIGFNPNSMDWFIAGINYAHNSMIIEKMANSIRDMQVEIRNLQNATFSINSITSEFMGKMSRQKREILDEMDKTRESVLRTLRECSREAIETHDVYEDEEDLSPYFEEEVIGDPIVPQNIDPVLLAPALSTPINTKTPEEIIYTKKEKILLEVGFSMSEIKTLGKGGVDVLVTDKIVEMSDAGWSKEQKDEAFEEMIEISMEIGLLG
nr:TPA_asm: P [Pogostemom alphacytorhabdovirus 1_Pip]